MIFGHIMAPTLVTISATPHDPHASFRPTRARPNLPYGCERPISLRWCRLAD